MCTERCITLLAAVLGCTVLAACGSFSITPTSPEPVPPPPITMSIRGTLSDGGTFEGSFTYGVNDIDGRVGFGRYRIGFWDVMVHGGSASKDFRFTQTEGGRAVIETTNTPKPAMGISFLWPEADPSVQRLTPYVLPVPGYDPDVQPSRTQFGPFLQGSIEEHFGVFEDGAGGVVVVTSLQLQ